MTQCGECDDAVAATLARQASVRERERRDVNMARSGLPIAYRQRKRHLDNLAGIDSDPVGWLSHAGESVPGFYIYGRAGTFKTSIAAAYLENEIACGHVGIYVSVPDLLADIHASYSRNDEDSRADIVARCVDAPLLVLDDLGQEKASDHGAGVILQILDGRYRNQRAGSWLIVTSNYDLDGLCNRFPSDEVAAPIKRRLGELTVSMKMGGA